MWPRLSHTLAPLTETVSEPKSRKILWNDALKDSFKELKCMVSTETLLSYTYLTIHNKPIALLSRRLSKIKHYYNATKGELIVIVEYLKKCCRILFGYEINVYSDNNKKTCLCCNPE